jgi:malonyl-CoA/methylmalonyl-CoA synthetase
MTRNLFDLFHSRFPADKSGPFIETGGGRTYSYAEMEQASGRLARLLDGLGVKPGDRLAVQVEKSPEAVFLYLASLRLGAVYLPLNTAYRATEVEFFLTDAEPKVLICRPEDEAERGALARASDVAHVLTLDADGRGSLARESRGLDADYPTNKTEADDIATLLYTSGTTGRPKGAMLSHGNLAANMLTLHRAWGWEPEDVMLHALPLFHTHGLFVALGCVLLNGTGMLFLPRFDADQAVRLLPRASVFMGVPTHYVRLLAHPGLTRDACRAMRLFVSGSAPLLEETFHAFKDRTGHTILERCGMTETGMNMSNPLDGKRIAGTVGPPLPGIEVRVADARGHALPTGETGMLEVRGPNVFKGYWRRGEKTAADFRDDGYFITGDLARIDEGGYVSIVGRAKDMIISGGYNVYPKEVETVIDAVDGIAESAVVGLAHPEFGEAVVAVVRLHEERGTPSEGEIIAAVKKDLANYKVPKRVFFAGELPRNVMGKVQKNVLRERFADTFSATPGTSAASS